MNCSSNKCVLGACRQVSIGYSICECPIQYEGEYCQYGLNLKYTINFTWIGTLIFWKRDILEGFLHTSFKGNMDFRLCS